MEEKCDGRHFELKRVSLLEHSDNAAKIVLFSSLSLLVQQVCTSNGKASFPYTDKKPFCDAS